MSSPETPFIIPTAEDYTKPMLRLNSDFYHYGNGRLALSMGVNHLRRVSPQRTSDLVAASILVSRYFAFPHSPTDINTKAGRRVAKNVMDGLMTGAIISGEVFGDDFPLEEGIKDGLAVSIDTDGPQTGFQSLVAVALIEHGDRGLELIGERNRRFLAAWEKGAAVGGDSDARRLYATGVGMGIIGPYNTRLAMDHLSEDGTVHSDTNL